MKKILLTLTVAGLMAVNLYAQEEIDNAISHYRNTSNSRLAADAEIFQATIKQGVNANQFLIYLRPNTNIVNTSIIAAGAPQVVFSVLGNTPLTFTTNYHLGGSPTFSQSSETVGGRSRIVLGPNSATTPTFPWNANEERLAYTITLTNDDTIGARLEHDVNLGQYSFYVADQPTASDWTHYTTPFYTGGMGSFIGLDGIFRFVTIPGNIITPVAFIGFDAACNDKGALLIWSTATETNSDFFEIQKSANGTDWKTVDKVKAAGTSFELKRYQYLDLEGGNVQYRLRQVDIDGKSVLTPIRRTTCEGKSFSSTLFPVPAKDKMTLVVRSDKNITTNLQILDMNGRAVKQMRTNFNNGNTNIIIDVSLLPQGEYMLMSTDPSVNVTKKFTVAR